jgi:hypothetical protein
LIFLSPLGGSGMITQSGASISTKINLPKKI